MSNSIYHGMPTTSRRVTPPAKPSASTRPQPQPPSHLRHVSNGSSDNRSVVSRPASRTGTAQHEPTPAKVHIERSIIRVHDEAFSKEEVLIDLDCFPGVKTGDLLAIVPSKSTTSVRDFQDTSPVGKKDRKPPMLEGHSSDPVQVEANGHIHDVHVGKRYLFMAKNMSKELRAKRPAMEVSVSKQISDAFRLKHRSNVILVLTDFSLSAASHVELSFKDEYLARSDMWRLAVSELSNKAVYKGQKILFMGTIRTQVTAVFIHGRKVQSAFFSNHTKPIFRSESARYTLFVQMSKEMWDFNSEGSGEIMFNKVVNGFLPALFKKWASMKARHLVTLVLFTRVEYDTGMTSELKASVHDSSYHTGTQPGGNKKPYKDFYRVVVVETPSTEWKSILHQLKREFKFFRRDISMHRFETIGLKATRMEATPSLAMYGNLLEAINMATSQFAQDYIDRDLMRTGISIVVITPCAGIFEVEYDALRLTTEVLLCNGIGIDLICLPKVPLHSTPILRYRNPEYAAFQEALQFKTFRSEESTPRQNAPLSAGASSLAGSLSPSKASLPDHTLRATNSSTNPPQPWCYAMPDWIDVSFWTGSSQDRHKNFSVGGRRFRKKATPRASDFEIRCKMYELEMSSIIEDTMTEISVTPLQHDSLFPQMMIRPREILGTQRRQHEPKHSGILHREKVYGALQEYVSGPARPLLDRHSSQDERGFFKALDLFDMNNSEILEEHIVSQQHSKKSFKTGSEETVRKLLAEDSKVFGTSFVDDRHGEFKGLESLAIANERLNAEPRRLEGKNTPRKNSLSGTMTPKTKTSPAKPLKLGRQISFGRHGFGIAAPKAATAEVHTEHANAPTPNASTGHDSKKSSSNIASLSLLSTPRPSDRPTSSSQKTKTRSSTQSTVDLSFFDAVDVEKGLSRPLTVKSALQSLDSQNQFKSRSLLGSVYNGSQRNTSNEDVPALQATKTDDTQRVYTSKLLAGVNDIPAKPSTPSLAPWLNVINPSNPTAGNEITPIQLKKWQHVFPRPMLTHSVRWKSLRSPASVPLTTEFFPSKQQLDSEYEQKPYNISQNIDDDLNELPKREEFLRELIGLRLSQSFQIVTGPAVAEAFGQKSLKIANGFGRIAGDRVSVFMSMGNIIHQLSCVDGTEVEVNVFKRKFWTPSTAESERIMYNPAIRGVSAHRYISRQIVFGNPREDFNWNYVDNYIAGFDDEMSEHLRFWRARFVLIPVAPPMLGHKQKGEDTQEEIRLEGIRELTQMWQRYRYIPPSERRYQHSSGPRTKDPNPLDVVYKTEDPSIVVTQELETLPIAEIAETPIRRTCRSGNERFRKLKLDIGALAEAIQAPVEKGGIRMQNRSWHLRLHYNCFIGSEMTTWLLDNFEDIEDRDEAVEFGNKLMAKEEPLSPEKEMGIFVHVEKRHSFRDGQYFYQITGEHAKKHPDVRSGWFATNKRRDNSVPSTPGSEIIPRDSPRPERSRSGSRQEDISDSGATTPTTPTTTGGIAGGKRPRISLSNVMKYDVDVRKRSYRTERINLHYDRLHNPDSCYHIRIDWVGVTPKLIEDAIESWATTAERYGLRLVEAPIHEACTIADRHPFRSPYEIKLAKRPPAEKPRTHYDANSFEPQVQTGPASRHYYQKAIMRKFNFVLDIEAARNFPSTVDVTYSWGRPDFKYTQYIHRSGILLAEITDEGNFLLVANRLYNNRTAAAREHDRFLKKDINDRRMLPKEHQQAQQPWISSPMLRPTIVNPLTSPLLKPLSHASTSSSLEAPIQPSSASLAQAFKLPPVPNSPETIRIELEDFCNDPQALETFYKEIFEKATPPNNSPFIPANPSLNQNSNSNANLNTLTSPRSTPGSESIPTLGLPPGVLAPGSAGGSPGTIGGGESSGSTGTGMMKGAVGAFTRRPSLGSRPNLQSGLGLGLRSGEGGAGRSGGEGAGGGSGSANSASSGSGGDSLASGSPRSGSLLEVEK